MLPEVLPGWDFQKTDRYRWQMDSAEDYINATYRDPQKRRHMFHVSKWKPGHVTYALDELYGVREPHPFDVWAARGQFIFAVKIAGGTVDNAHTLLMACPALSKSYQKLHSSVRATDERHDWRFVRLEERIGEIVEMRLTLLAPVLLSAFRRRSLPDDRVTPSAVHTTPSRRRARRSRSYTVGQRH